MGNQGVVVPDVAQMVAFNPEEGMQAGANSAPLTIREVLKVLPAPAAFKGPYVNVVAFLEFLNTADAIPALATGGAAGDQGGVKREHSPESESDEEPSDTAKAAPPKSGPRPNIFQKRMQKQFKPA